MGQMCKYGTSGKMDTKSVSQKGIQTDPQRKIWKF